MRRLAILGLAALTACSTSTAPATTEAVPPTSTIAAPPPSTSPSPPTPAPATTDLPAITRPPATTLTPPTTTTLATTLPPRETWYAASITGWLPDAFVAGLDGVPGVEDVSVVWVGNARVVEVVAADGTVVDRAPDGLAYPVELQAFDPEAHAAFAPDEVAAALMALGEDEIALGHRSAAFRGIGIGGALRLEDGTLLTVASIVDDRWVGAAEAVTTSSDPVPLGADRPRYAIFRSDAAAELLAEQLTALGEVSVKLRAETDAPVLRHADAVQPQIVIKTRFGEFAFRPAAGRSIEMDPVWVEEHIVTDVLPLLGETSCHRDFLALLRDVMTHLERTAPPGVIDPSAFLGCWNPRMVSGRRDLSRHAWGVAADINFFNALDGPGSPVASELVAAMEAVGITSGHAWTVPDPGHFEWVGSGPIG